jgi:hypothetical protein
VRWGFCIVFAPRLRSTFGDFKGDQDPKCPTVWGVGWLDK